MSFTLDLTKFATKANADIKLVIQKISMEAFKRIILRTPVDTGRARANWGCTIGQPRAGLQIESTDKSGGATIAAMTGTTQTFNGQGSIFLVNNLPYINALENGSSTQSPQGMVQVTMAEMVSHYGSIAKK